MPSTASQRKKHHKSFRYEPPEWKRRRLNPDSVGSSFQRSDPAEVVDLDTSAEATADATAEATADATARCLPSPKAVSRQLSEIDHNLSLPTKAKALRALKQLQTWLVDETTTTESKRELMESFRDYGGIARTLDFLEANLLDMNCATTSAAVIADFLSFRWNATEGIREVAIEMAKTIVRRNGIQILLRANKEFAVGHGTFSATKHIWIALGRTVNGEETRRIMDKTQKLSILNDATDCVFRLASVRTGNSIETRNADVLRVLLYAIANTIKDASIEKKDLSGVDVVPGCLEVMKRNEVWERNDDVVIYALGILTICAKQKTLLKKKDFEQLLPMLIHCMSQFHGNSQIRSFVLALLESACQKLPKEMMEKEGVLEAISALLKPEGVSEDVKEKARSIMRKILN